MKFNTAFWRWFGKSKVVDERGEPLVVYHGTAQKFTEFKADPDLHAEIPVYFFTPDIRYAEGYAGSSGHIIPAYLSVQKIFDTREKRCMNLMKKALKDDGNQAWEIKAYIEDYFCDGLPHWGNMDAVTVALANGFDGVVLCEREGKYTSIVVFDPRQIKSATGNDGTWDKDDPDIRSNPFKPKSQRGWVSPDGERIPVQAHEGAARKILAERYPGVRWQDDKMFVRDGAVDPILVLEHKGWVRVVETGVYEVWSALTYAKHLRRNLVDLLAELPDDFQVLIDAPIGKTFDGWKAKDILEKYA